MNESDPRNARSALLAGHSGRGYKLSPAMGGIAADLAGGPHLPADRFITTNGRTAA